MTALLLLALLLQPAPGPGYARENGISYRPDLAAEDVYVAEKCRLDVYHPTGVEGFPTVVWFHGGGLRSGEPRVPAMLKGKGIAVVAAGYRLWPEVGAPAYIEDAAAAVAWTLEHIADYGGDPAKVVVAGHSAGGYLTLMVGLDERWLAAHGRDADEIALLVPYSGHAITHFTVREERGIPGEQPVVDDLAPLYHVRADAPPLVLITGDRDLELLGRYEETAYLWRMMQVAGHEETTLYELEGFSHTPMVPPAHRLLLRHVRETFAAPATRPAE